MDMFEHPGNLGAVRGTLWSIHHATWSAYPQGDDFYTPLLQMTAFPPDTEFVVVDDIDQSFLLVADVEKKKLDNPYDERHFHVAIWYEDLRELRTKGMAEGVEKDRRREDYGWRWGQDEEEENSGSEPDFLNADDELRAYVWATGNRLWITYSGRNALLTELRKSEAELHKDAGERVSNLFKLGYYDTAIREACVQLEDEIKKYLNVELYGKKLTEKFVAQLLKEKKILESYVRTFRQELRTVFKFIRNDFMHNLREADEAAAYAMLFRITRARSMLDLARQ